MANIYSFYLIFHIYLDTLFLKNLMKNNCFSHRISIFHGRIPPEEGNIVGFGAIIEFYDL